MYRCICFPKLINSLTDQQTENAGSACSELMTAWRHTTPEETQRWHFTCLTYCPTVPTIPAQTSVPWDHEKAKHPSFWAMQRSNNDVTWTDCFLTFDAPVNNSGSLQEHVIQSKTEVSGSKVKTHRTLVKTLTIKPQKDKANSVSLSI